MNLLVFLAPILWAMETAEQPSETVERAVLDLQIVDVYTSSDSFKSTPVLLTDLEKVWYSYLVSI